MTPSRCRLAAVLAGAIALSLAVGAPAEARRGGSFGSRGSRTYYAPAPTYSSPGYVAPVQRSMTAPPSGYSPGQPAYAPRPSYGYGYGAQPGYRPGFGGGLLTGLATGGLLGAMMGHGFGGYGYGGGWGGGMGGMGLFASLFQLGFLALIAWFAIRLFRRNGGRAQPAGFSSAYDAGPGPDAGYGGPWGGGPAYAPPAAAPPSIAITSADQQAFERLLIEVQDAFGREDYAGLRERTTPEVMSYLAEELSDNATHGRRNEVSRTRLLRCDVSESWREGDADYATAALNYESVDVMRDRQSGQVVQGDPDAPTATTEVWTFVRHGGGPWKLSAIQT
jgi:predicted lipid-binding transport protein (Tim44 family)